MENKSKLGEIIRRHRQKKEQKGEQMSKEPINIEVMMEDIANIIRQQFPYMDVEPHLNSDGKTYTVKIENVDEEDEANLADYIKMIKTQMLDEEHGGYWEADIVKKTNRLGVVEKGSPAVEEQSVQEKEEEQEEEVSVEQEPGEIIENHEPVEYVYNQDYSEELNYAFIIEGLITRLQSAMKNDHVGIHQAMGIIEDCTGCLRIYHDWIEEIFAEEHLQAIERARNDYSE